MVAVLFSLSVILAAADEPPEAEMTLKGKGLSLTQQTWVLADEKEFDDKFDELRPIQKQFRDAERSQERLNLQQAEFKDNGRQLKDRYDQLSGMLDRVPVGDVDAHNRIVREMNQISSRLEKQQFEGNEDPAVQKIRSAYQKARVKYVDAVRELQSMYETINERYAELSSDSDVTAALEAFNKDAEKPTALGPSRSFKNSEKELTRAASRIQSGEIKLRKDGGVNIVDVLLNGDVHESFILDTGASIICLPFSIAKKVGLEPTDEDQTIKITIANGETINGKLMTLESVRVGDFEVEDVACAVLPEEFKGADALLGNSFLKHFNHQIDPDGPTLLLSKVGEEVKEKQTSARKKKSSRTKN